MRSPADSLAGDHGVPAPIRAALAHLELVAIQPFNDGNGRTARILSRLLLVRGGYALDGLVSLDAWLDIGRSDYFAAIRASIGRSYEPGYDATPFVGFFLIAVARAAEHVLARIRGMGEVQVMVRRDVMAGSCCRRRCSTLSCTHGSAEACAPRTTSGSPGARRRPRAAISGPPSAWGT
jgi:hypothetical protein